MNNKQELPEGIGPHEGKELELMLQGQKPMAFFSDTIPSSMELPEAEFLPFVENGQIIKVEETYTPHKTPNIKLRHLYYACAGEEWRINELVEIDRAVLAGKRAMTDEDEKRTGYLLGYTDKQISTFIEWKKACKHLIR